jgi:hypothetical protein
MSPLLKNTFDCTSLNETTSSQLKAILVTIRRNSRATIKSTLAIGMALFDAKRHLDHGQFKAWVHSQCGFSVRTAERYMRAAEILEDKYDTVSHLQLSTIYRLSAKSISQSIVAQILNVLTNDGPLSDNEVNALIDQSLQVDTPAPGTTLDEACSAGLIKAWLAASPADRLALLNSDPAGFVNGAWQFMDADDRAHFMRERSAEIVADDKSDHRLVTSSESASKVVQLFSASDDQADADERAPNTSSFSKYH